MASEEELRARLREAAEMPYGPAQIALIEQVVQHADAGHHTGLGFDARMLATSAYLYGGEPGRSFVPFSWCLAEYDRDPGRRSAYDHHALLWYFKNVVGALISFPEISLHRTYHVLDDMERRYREAGHSMHAVYEYRHRVAAHVGDTAAADGWYARWSSAPRDELSDCAGCDPTSKVHHLTNRGRDEEAVAIAEPVLTGRLDCVEQPQSILTSLLLPYLRTGRLEQAAEAHRRAYRLLRPHLRNLDSVGVHARFCALTGNETRGLEIVQRHLDWLDRAPSPYDAMEFAADAAYVLRRLTALGHGELTVLRHSTEIEVAQLADELAGTAEALAAQFDERNGTAYQSGRIAERLAAPPLVEYLPLSATAARTRRSAAAAEPARPPVNPVTARAVVPTLPPGELLDLAEELVRTDQPGRARAVWRAFDERFAPEELTTRDAARRAEGRGQELAARRDAVGAQAAWRSAAELYQQVSDEVGTQAAWGRLGLLLCLTGRTEEGLRLVERSTEYLLAHGSADRRAGAQSRLGTALLAVGRPADALAALERAAELAGEADDAYLGADVLLRQAHCMSMLDRPEEQRELATRARERYRELAGERYGEGYAAACLLYGDSFHDPADAERALAAFDEAVQAAEAVRSADGRRDGGDRVVAEARLARARALAGRGRAAEAVDDYVEVIACYTEQEVPDGATYARYELAAAYRQAGRLTEAAEAAEEAVTGLEKLGAVQAADRCRYLLAGIYRDLGEDAPALELLDELAANLDGFDNLPARGRVHEEAGEIHYRADRDLIASQRFAAAAGAFAQAGLPLDELRARRRAALALHWAGEQDASFAALAEIDALVAALPAELAAEPAAIWEQAMTGYETTKILIGVDRLEEALPRVEPVPAAFRSVDAFREALLAELLLGELLLRLNRPGEAERVLRSVLTGLPRDAEPVAQAAWLLAEALTMLGRTGEAAELRRQYDLDPD